jgi:hypothetical protein
MHAARPNQVMRQLQELLPSQLSCSALIDLVQRMRPLHGPLPAAAGSSAAAAAAAAAGDAGDGSSSSSNGWRSVLGVYLKRGYPFPALRLLERGVLLADVAEGAAGELDAELYCRWAGGTGLRLVQLFDFAAGTPESLAAASRSQCWAVFGCSALHEP